MRTLVFVAAAVLAAAVPAQGNSLSALAVFPAQRHYLSAPAPVTVQGSGFLASPAIQVLFAGQPAAQIAVLSDTSLTCVPPSRGPGVVDLTIDNGLSQASMPRGFAYTPAVDHIGLAAPGQTTTICFHQPAGVQMLAAWGVGPRASLQFPPLVGTVEIAPNYTLVFAPYWLTDRFDLPLPVPPNPSLTGVTFLFQSLVGTNLFWNAQGTFSNCYELTIQ